MAAAAKSIELHPSGPPRGLVRPDGFKTVSISVGFDGGAIRLLTSEGQADALSARVEQPGWASFPKTHTDSEYSSIVSVSGHSGSRETRLFGLTATFPKIEMLPNGEILVVASRCFRNPDGSHEMNAKVYGTDGKQNREFLLGDGVKHIQTDAEGRIWVGYSDEGIFGNFGWQHAGGPFGAAGLSCFDKSGQKMWDYGPPEGFDHIADCYALNVSSSGAWSHYYTDFPIAFVDSNWHVRCWNTELSGGHTFAVGDNKVLLYGGYGERRTACNLLSLDDHDARSVAEVSLALPREIDLSKDKVIGRDKRLHVFQGDDWYVFSIDSLN
jgi:hypothetical protein